jgi:hypothetical protein
MPCEASHTRRDLRGIARLAPDPITIAAPSRISARHKRPEPAARSNPMKAIRTRTRRPGCIPQAPATRLPRAVRWRVRRCPGDGSHITFDIACSEPDVVDAPSGIVGDDTEQLASRRARKWGSVSTTPTGTCCSDTPASISTTRRSAIPTLDGSRSGRGRTPSSTSWPLQVTRPPASKWSPTSKTRPDHTGKSLSVFGNGSHPGTPWPACLWRRRRKLYVVSA